MYERYNGHCENNKILLKCKNEGGITLLGVLTDDGEIDAIADLLNINADFQVASININTKEFSHPCVKIEFSCNIEILADTVVPETIFTIAFQVFKRCNNQILPIPIGSEWLYSSTLVVDNISDAFSFFVCDCNCTCKNDCCTYIVAVTITPEDFVSQFTGQAAINNVSLSAIIVENL